MAQEIDLKSGKCYLVVGLPSSGKSSLLKNNKLPEDMIVSSDNTRKMLLGETLFIDEAGAFPVPNFSEDDSVFIIINTILEARFKNNLTTFFDMAALVDPVDRNKVKNLAAKYGVETEILLLDTSLEDCIKYDKLRKNRVGASVINNFHNKMNFENETLPIHNVNVNTKFNLIPNALPHNKYDLIGDTHGLYEEFLRLIEKLGYKDENGIYKHPEGRNLLLLGDFVDRGTQSVEMLRFVVKQSKYTQDKFILGNHENKIINFFRYFEKHNEVPRMAIAPALTCSSLLKLAKEEREEMLKVLTKMDKYFIYDNIAFVHGHIKYFNPFETPSSNLMYGDDYKGRSKEGRNNDDDYSKMFELGHNNFYLVRGHIASLSLKQKHVLSLEEGSAFSGQLCAVKLEDLQTSIKQGLGVNNLDILVREEVKFNFSEYRRKNFDLFTKIKKLETDKLITNNVDGTKLLNIFKYKKDVFFKKKWEEHHDLLNCRGIAFDFAGNIVQLPFDKIFNFGEPNEKGDFTAVHLDRNKEYVSVEKLNGFFGAITKHPFKNDLLMTTTGSFESDFVGYIDELVKTKGHYPDLMKFTAKNPNITLMFEVLHESDPHIVKYDKEEFDIYLIGARVKEQGSKLFTEEQLDVIGEKLNLKRPKWEIKKLSDILDELHTVQHEGFMVRDIETGDTLFKGKSDYYLTVKFLSRLSDKRINHMFKNPHNFKTTIEEEGFPLVDYITSKFDLETFKSMDDETRKEVVKKAIVDINESLENSGKQKLKAEIKRSNKPKM